MDKKTVFKLTISVDEYIEEITPEAINQARGFAYARILTNLVSNTEYVITESVMERTLTLTATPK